MENKTENPSNENSEETKQESTEGQVSETTDPAVSGEQPGSQVRPIPRENQNSRPN